jgi:hypothetical protein
MSSQVALLTASTLRVCYAVCSVSVGKECDDVLFCAFEFVCVDIMWKNSVGKKWKSDIFACILQFVIPDTYEVLV